MFDTVISVAGVGMSLFMNASRHSARTSGEYKKSRTNYVNDVVLWYSMLS